ncbi:universal stress protein [Natrinema sp. 1APR25-10V2]|uniref:universal stress protein n=1 Tax=Natrinema sp. 1APR25-10V2 TaxID=2951081 RepID=UPI0028764520|nr:universal stress protein [Natrinema sp. 1APR25-10V2]MDS0477067.1 universal stress protein [Natrinema sp. 1APR25-10V2]
MALDESPQARHALEYTIEAYPEAEITAVHAIDFSNYRCGQSYLYYAPELLDRLADVENTVFDPAHQLAADYGREITTSLKPGPPTDTIVEYAVIQECDQIVIGSHGRTGLSRLLVGSIAETVARRAPVPVTIIRSAPD